MRHEALYLDDALKAIGELRRFLATTTEAEYLTDPLRQSYVYHRLVIIGEAAVKLREAYGTRYPAVPWAQLAGLRNRLVHAYFEISAVRVWEIATAGLVELERQFAEILEREFTE